MRSTSCFGRVPGRLCYLTVAGGATFSTMTGSSMANTAMLGSLMVPEMQRRGYNWRMSLGPILGTGGLAMIIPPSNLGVLLASVASIDVGRLLIAGVIPGFLLAFLYRGMILPRFCSTRRAAPSYDVAPSTWRREALRSSCVNILPMGVVVFMVDRFHHSRHCDAVGSGGLRRARRAHPGRRLPPADLEAIIKSFDATVSVGGMVFFIIISAPACSASSSPIRAPVSGCSNGRPRSTFRSTVMLLCMFAVLILLGMFMDPVSMILIAVPIFMPHRFASACRLRFGSACSCCSRWR